MKYLAIAFLLFSSNAYAAQTCIDYANGDGTRIAQGLTQGGTLCPGAVSDGQGGWTDGGTGLTIGQCAKRVVAQMVKRQVKNYEDQVAISAVTPAQEVPVS